MVMALQFHNKVIRTSIWPHEWLSSCVHRSWNQCFVVIRKFLKIHNSFFFLCLTIIVFVEIFLRYFELFKWVYLRFRNFNFVTIRFIFSVRFILRARIFTKFFQAPFGLDFFLRTFPNSMRRNECDLWRFFRVRTVKLNGRNRFKPANFTVRSILRYVRDRFVRLSVQSNGIVEPQLDTWPGKIISIIRTFRFSPRPDYVWSVTAFFFPPHCLSRMHRTWDNIENVAGNFDECKFNIHIIEKLPRKSFTSDTRFVVRFNE